MARSNIVFTNKYEVKCEEIDETKTVSTFFPFDSSYKVYASEFIENDSATNVTYSAGNKMTCYRFIEGDDAQTTQDPKVYIKTFVPEITYSTSTGFTVTNFSTLLNSTGTTINDWEVGLLKYHKAHLRHDGGSWRHFRTSWNYVFAPDDPVGTPINRHIFNIELRINSSGVVTNTKDMYKYKANFNNNNYAGQTTGFLGIRLRYKSDVSCKSKYSRTMISTTGSSFSTVTTSSYIRN